MQKTLETKSEHKVFEILFSVYSDKNIALESKTVTKGELELMNELLAWVRDNGYGSITFKRSAPNTIDRILEDRTRVSVN